MERMTENGIRIRKAKELEEENEKLKENIAWYEKEEDRLREENNRLKNNAMEDMRVQTKLEEEIRSLELENRAMKVESEELKMWLIEKLPLALLKEYMNKFEGVDLKNV